MKKPIPSTQSERKKRKRLPIWALILIDLLSTCLALALFALFHIVLPRIQEEKAGQGKEYAHTITEETITSQVAPKKAADGEFQKNQDDWKFGYLTSEETVMTENSYASHDIFLEITAYDEGEGTIQSPYTVADIYVRNVKCLQSYFAGAKFIPTGHGENILDLMAESEAILASNGDYYSMQLNSGVLRNGVLYRYPAAN